MKRIIEGKQIDEWPAIQCISYYRDRFWGPQAKTATTVNGNFIAKRYNQIIQAIKETNAKVHLTHEKIEVDFTTGHYSIGRDLLVDSFLIPAINSTIGFNSIS